MTKSFTIGILGFGHIGKYLHSMITSDPNFELKYVYVRSSKPELNDEIQVTDAKDLQSLPVDLCIEAATHEVVGPIGENVLVSSDLMVLSCSALSFPTIEKQLTDAANKHNHKIWIPHGALLGVDGLLDSQTMLKSVSISSIKSPKNLDFSFTNHISSNDISQPTLLYEGPTRGLAQMFPRNFNSHVAIALASLGLDETTSKFVADPEINVGRHTITAQGEGFKFEIFQNSLMTGVTGDYTLFSTWGSVQRLLNTHSGINFI